MEKIKIATAFAAGVASFASPCVLPLLPAYISLISGVSAEELMAGNTSFSQRRVTLCSVFFVAGFAVTFSLMGAASSTIGRLLYDNSTLISKVSGILLMLFGLHLTGAFNIKLLNYEKRLSMSRFQPGILGAFFMGIAFAVGWSPCIGPVLAGILLMAGTAGTATQGVLLLFAYSMGLGLPFLAAGILTGRFFKAMSSYRRFLNYTEIAAGIILILAGISLFSGDFKNI